MPYLIEATCPNCKKIAKGLSQIDDQFGWRIISGEKIPQSHCRTCRSKKRSAE